MEKADIIEVFSSIQGEGPFVGVRQVFVRFKRCNLACSFCDVGPYLSAREYSTDELLAEITALESSGGPHHSVSLTGGEPLLYTDFVCVIARSLRGRGIRVYLETNGTLPEELVRVLDRIDIVAMDIKLPSSTGGRPFWREHEEFLRYASLKKKDVFVKVVVTADTTARDITQAASIVRGVSGEIPLILQPVTPVNTAVVPVSVDSLFSFVRIARNNGLKDVRVIPQMHRLIAAR